MQQLHRKYILIPLFILTFILTGFVREFLFVNINYQLSYLYYHDEYNWVSSSLDFIKSCSYMQLYYAKWGLTFLFSVIYLLLTIAVVHYLFHKKTYVFIALSAFGLFIAAACVSFGLGIITQHTPQGYHFARIFMGVVQSPIIAMIVIPAFLFHHRMSGA